MQATTPTLPRSRVWRRSAAGGWREVRLPAIPCLWHMPHPRLIAAGILAAVACVSIAAQGPAWAHAPVLSLVNLATTLVFAFTGLLLCKEDNQRVTAVALGLAGVFRSLDFIDAWNGSWPVYTLLFGGIDRVFGAWALLRYPNSGLSRPHRRYVLALAGWMLGGRTLLAVTTTARWTGHHSAGWWPTLFAREQLSDVLNYVVHGGEGVLGLVLIGLLVNRLKRSRGLDRIVITPITAAGIAGVTAAIASAVMMTLSLAGTPNQAYLVEGLTDIALPAAFLVSLVQRLLLIRNVTELTAQVAVSGDLDAVRQTLRTALRDPTLDVLDSGSAGLRELGEAPERLVSFIHAEAGEPIAVVVADPVLDRYRELFDAATAATGLALRNAQLRARAVQENLEQVKASRTRIMEAELAERRRLERDLHDGVQQHLLGIAADLSAASRATADPVAADAFGEARDGLRAVLAELRDLAHGIHPALLTQGGLGAALADVAERLPLPVLVTVPPGRLDPAVETTLYYIACEALANVVKHADADSAQVTVFASDGSTDLVVADDGVGGVPAGAARRPASHGMANMADRAGALDGTLTIDSPPGQGTRLTVSLPCG